MASIEQKEAYEAFRRAAEDEKTARLLEIVNSPESDRVHAVEAAKELLDRGWERPE